MNIYWFACGVLVGLLIGSPLFEQHPDNHPDGWRIESEDGNCWMFYTDEEWEIWQRRDKEVE